MFYFPSLVRRMTYKLELFTITNFCHLRKHKIHCHPDDIAFISKLPTWLSIWTMNHEAKDNDQMSS